jgi:hypothetical protein
VWLIEGHVQREIQIAGLSKTVKAVLAGALAGLLLAATVLSANHWLHQLLHRTDSGSTHACLVCSLANGQADQSDAAAPAAEPVLPLFCGLRLAPQFQFQPPEYHLSPSRAPPAG